MNLINTKNPYLLGAIAGDIIGSVYEIENIKSTSFSLFSEESEYTDDTVLTIALADVILNNLPLVDTFQKYGRKYSNSGFGGSFYDWIFNKNPKPYNSWGNGSAMRVSSIGFAYDNENEVLFQAQRSAEITHNHIEGIKGAQAVAMCVFLAKHGQSKQDIKNYIEKNFGYDLSRTIDEIRPNYEFDVSCQGSVPEAIISFLESTDYESAIRLAISLGGDSDTIACIAGAIALAFYKEIPKEIINETILRLPDEFIDIINKFDLRFN